MVFVNVVLRELLIFAVVEINTGPVIKSKFGPARSDLRTANVVARATPPHNSAISIFQVRWLGVDK